MSHRALNEEWRHTMEELLVNLDIENPVDPSKLSKKLDDLWQRYGLMYARYLVVLRRLESVHDQMAHPQKRMEIRSVLESVIGRTLEIRDILCQIKKTEYPNISEFLEQLRVTPDAVELRVPVYFTEARAKALAERERQFDLLVKMAASSAPQEATPEEEAALEAQGLLRFKYRSREQQIFEQRAKALAQSMKAAEAADQSPREKELLSSEKLKEKLQARLVPAQKVLTMTDNKAALTIQRIFRGHLARKRTKEMRHREAVFLGMERNIRNKEDDPVEHAAENAARRKLIQAQNEEEYRQALIAERDLMLTQEGPEMKEEMRDQVVHWFLANKEQLGKFPPYPTVDEGGSAAIFCKDRLEKEAAAAEALTGAPTAAAAAAAARASSAPAAKGGKPAGKAGSASAMRSTKQSTMSSTRSNGKKGDKGAAPPAPEYSIPPSYFLTDIREGGQKYAEIWQCKDETKNLSQKHDVDMLRQGMRPEIEKEIRKELDETLRSELETLRAQVEKTRHQRRQKKKKPTGAGGKEEDAAPTIYTIGQEKAAGGKKPKGARHRRGRKDEDPAASRTIESLFAELVQKRVLLKAPRATFAQFVGAFNYMAATVEKQDGHAADPTPWDVRQALVQVAALPMACELVHAHCPPVRTICLFGPRGSGKTTLVHATATESGAVFFDITPSHAAETYSDRDVRMMMSAVFRVAREYQPAVILISDAEKLFVKAKGARGRTLDGAKFRKELTKNVKALKPADRVVVIGTSCNPVAAGKAFVQMFDRLYYVGHPDYPSRMKLWQHFIEQAAGVAGAAGSAAISASINVSTLARVSEGYTAGSIEQAVKAAFQVIMAQQQQEAGAMRASTMPKKLPTAEDYITQLAKLQPVFKAEDEDIRKWAAKLPTRELEMIEPEEAAPTKGKAPKKK